MKKTIFLHIGMPKTGTTSIQETLGSNREILLKQNVYYPSISPYNHSNTFNVILLEAPENNEVCRQQGVHDIKELKKMQDIFKIQWIDEFKKNQCSNFIISAELLMIGNKREIRQKIDKLMKIVKPFFDKIKVIVYVRSPMSYLHSFTQQILKNRIDALDEMKNITRRNLYKNQLSEYINRFGRENVIVRPFDIKAFKDGDLITDFLNCIDNTLKDDQIIRKRANDSLNHNACLLLSEYNRLFPRYIKGKINTKSALVNKPGVFNNILSRLDKSIKFSLDFKFNEKEAKRINEEIEFINKYLPQKHRFSEVTYSEEKMSFPTINDIPPRFFIEVINECNKEIESLISQVSQPPNLAGFS